MEFAKSGAGVFRRSGFAVCLAVSSLFASADEPPPRDWTPPAVAADEEYDWIQLTSGEWLKGEFVSMYEDSVSFDSVVLEDLTIDWDDIKQIHFQNPMGVRLEDRSVQRGSVVMKGGVLTFSGTNQAVTRDEVVSISPVRHSEWDRWGLEGRVSFDFQSGNTNETSYTASLSVTRRSVSTRFNLRYLGNYSKTEGSETANNHRASSNFDYYIDRRLFVRAIVGEYYRDRFQNISNQFTVGSGIGYQILDTGRLNWEAQIGPAYQYTEFYQVEPGADDTARSPALVLTTGFDFDVTDKIDYALSYQGVLTDQESGSFTQHLVTSLDYELTRIIDLFLMLQLDRVEDPKRRSDGSLPRKTDATVSFGLGVDL